MATRKTSTRVPGSLLPDDNIRLTGRTQLNRGNQGSVSYTPKKEYSPPSERSAPAKTTQPTQPTRSTSGGGGGGGAQARADAVSGGKMITPEPPVLDLQAIRDALAAISAQFDFQEGELTAEQEAARRGFKYLSETLGEQREAALGGLESEAAGRGLLRSGLFLQDSSDIEERSAEALARAQAERDARLRGIRRNLANLKAQERAKRANEARRLAQEQVGTKEATSRALELV